MKLLPAELRQQLPASLRPGARQRSDRVREILHTGFQLDLVCPRRECST